MQWLYNSGPTIADWLPLVALAAYLIVSLWAANTGDVVLIILYSPIAAVVLGFILFYAFASGYEPDRYGCSIDPGICGYSYRDPHLFCCGCK